jgi:hypothetical protein
MVMPGLVPGIHVLGRQVKTWLAGTSPAMTVEGAGSVCGLMTIVRSLSLASGAASS